MASAPIKALRKQLGLTQSQFALQLGLSNKASISQIETGARPCSQSVALRIEELSGGRINAASLNADVAASRAGLDRIDCAGHAPPVHASPRIADQRQVICDLCERRVDDPATAGCSAVDCPHAARFREAV